MVTKPVPPRGKAFKTKLLEAIREECLLGSVSHMSSKEEIERAYITHVAKRAFDDNDKDSAILLKELLSKSYPGMKSTLPTLEFDLPPNANPLEKANAFLDAVASGAMPPDVGALLVQAAKNMIDIEMATEMKARIAEIEASLGVNA